MLLARTAASAGLALLLAACGKATPDAAYLSALKDAQQRLDSSRGEDALLDEADAALQRLMRDRPQLPQAYVHAARVAVRRGKLSGSQDSAENLVRTALRLDPDECSAHAVLGNVLLRRKDYAGALQELDAADRSDCAYVWRHVTRGRALEALERFEQAQAAYAKVSPGADDDRGGKNAYVEAQLGLASVALHRGDAQGVRTHALESLRQAQDGDAWALGNAADWLWQAGDFDQAIDLAHQALQRRNYASGRRILADALYGKSLWLRSHAGDAASEAQAAALEQEAAALDVDPAKARAALWGSLANRDTAFRELLQQRIAADRTDNL